MYYLVEIILPKIFSALHLQLKTRVGKSNLNEIRRCSVLFICLHFIPSTKLIIEKIGISVNYSNLYI